MGNIFQLHFINHFYLGIRRFPTHFMEFVEGQATEKLNLKTAGRSQKKIRPKRNGRKNGLGGFFFAGEQREIELGGGIKKCQGNQRERCMKGYKLYKHIWRPFVMPSSSKKTPSYPWNSVLFFEEPKKQKCTSGFFTPPSEEKEDKVFWLGGRQSPNFECLKFLRVESIKFGVFYCSSFWHVFVWLDFFCPSGWSKKRIVNLRSVFYALWGQRWPLIIIVGCRPFLLHLLKAGYSLPRFREGLESAMK